MKDIHQEYLDSQNPPRRSASKKILQGLVALTLVAGVTLMAEPFKTWFYEESTEYDNDMPIPAADAISYNLYCGTTQGGPYDLFGSALDEPPHVDMDMGPLVQNNPGDYYCVATATSSLYLTESRLSNEVNFTVLPTDLGLRPKPPVLSLQ